MKSIGEFKHEDDVVTKEDLNSDVKLGRRFSFIKLFDYNTKNIITLSFKSNINNINFSATLSGFYNRNNDTGFKKYEVATNNGVNFVQKAEVVATGTTRFIENAMIESVEASGTEIKITIKQNNTSQLGLVIDGCCLDGNELINVEAEGIK